MSETEFDVGDRVKVDVGRHSREGEIGTVSEINDAKVWPYQVEYDQSTTRYGEWFSSAHLELVEDESPSVTEVTVFAEVDDAAKERARAIVQFASDVIEEDKMFDPDSFIEFAKEKAHEEMIDGIEVSIDE